MAERRRRGWWLLALVLVAGAIGIATGTLRVLEARKPLTLDTHHAALGSVTALAFSPSGELLAAGGESSLVVVWSLRDGAVLGQQSMGLHQVWALAFSPDSKLLAVGDGGPTVQLRSAPELAVVTSITPTAGSMSGHSLAFSPSGWLLALNAHDREDAKGAPPAVELWDLATPSPEFRKSLRMPGYARCLALLPGSDALVSATATGDVTIHKLSSGATGSPLGTDHLWDAAFSPQATLVGGWSPGGRLVVREVASGATVGTWSLDENIQATAFSPDGLEVAVVEHQGNSAPAKRPSQVEAFSLETKQRTSTIALDGWFWNALAYSPDGDWLAVGGPDRVLLIRR